MWDFLKAAKRLQDLAQELEHTTLTGESPDSQVRIVMTGHQAIQAIQIHPALLQDPQALEKALIQAYDDARQKLQRLVIEKLGTELPFSLPGLPGNIGLA
ncbi:MAG: hypothetical protein KatS3mg026_0729 [Bacteroidia bacterium]|nr:MAG: hypothetical protein KatS3mg026_0729 [Bacteroidia bacterium]